MSPARAKTVRIARRVKEREPHATTVQCLRTADRIRKRGIRRVVIDS